MSTSIARMSKRRPPHHPAIARLIVELEGQGCEVFTPMANSGAVWDLIALCPAGELRLVWSARVLKGKKFALYVENIGGGASARATRSKFRTRSLGAGFVPLIAVHNLGRPERDRWQIDGA